MGNLKKWLGGNADVMLDETTGAMLVKEDQANTLRSDRFQDILTSAAAQGGALFGIAVAGKKIAVTEIVVSVATLLTVTLEDADGNDLLVLYAGANGGAGKSFHPSTPLCIDTANKDLKLTTSGAGNISVTVTGYYYV